MFKKTQENKQTKKIVSHTFTRFLRFGCFYPEIVGVLTVGVLKNQK